MADYTVEAFLYGGFDGTPVRGFPGLCSIFKLKINLNIGSFHHTML